jgi:integrase
MPLRLTETAIAKAVRKTANRHERRDLADAACPGLRLRLTPTGGKTWVLACRDRHGRMRRFQLGAFPDMGISEARNAARAMHTRVKQEGADPVAERRRDRAIGKAAMEGIGTLSALLAIYGDKRGCELKRWKNSKRLVELVFKPFLKRPLVSVTAADLQMQADSYGAKQSAAAAVRYVRPIIKWGVARGYVTAGLAQLDAPATLQRRDRVLSRDELAALVPVLRMSRRPYAQAMRFMLLTLARREEVGQARWNDIDLTVGTWAIKETKNGQPHVVPLPRQAIDLLREIKPSVRGKTSALVFSTRTGALLRNWHRETKAIQGTSRTAGWTRHDLRRTGATMLGEMGELPDIIEAALNHVSIRSPLAATYNRSRYRPQVAAALQRLADALDVIDTEAANVVPLRLGAAGLD